VKEWRENGLHMPEFLEYSSGRMIKMTTVVLSLLVRPFHSIWLARLKVDRT
jgi:hypothetical protein